MKKTTEIRSILREQLAITEEVRRSNPHDFYGLDRAFTYNYLSDFPKWREMVVDFFREIRDANEEVINVDLCGSATATSLGADRNYSFRLGEKYFSFEDSSMTLVQGDIFNPRQFGEFIYRLREETEGVALATFFPVAGLQSYTPLERNKDVVYAQLAKRFRQVVEVLRPGGFFLMRRPFEIDGLKEFLSHIPQEENDLSLYVKQAAKDSGCTVRINPTIHGPHFLIRKRKKRSK